MISSSFLPSPLLRDCVKVYHLRHFKFDDSSSLPFKPYPPRPEQCLIFYPRGLETVEHVESNVKYLRSRSIIMGQYTFRTNRHIAKDFVVLIVEFYPGALYDITGIPQHTIANTDVDAEAVFSKEIRRVNERLSSTGDYQEMIDIVDAFLVERIKKLERSFQSIDQIGKLILQQSCKFSLDRLAKQAYLSPRQFERNFKHRVGVGPKTFSRIARLYQSYKMKSAHLDEDWLSIAVACGYHDYQHLAKDYRAFAGSTPSVLFQENKMAPEKYFDLPETF